MRYCPRCGNSSGYKVAAFTRRCGTCDRTWTMLPFLNGDPVDKKAFPYDPITGEMEDAQERRIDKPEQLPEPGTR